MRRLLWHLFGAAASLVLLVGSASLVAGNDTISISPWCWALVAAMGFFGTLRYASWYRTGD